MFDCGFCCRKTALRNLHSRVNEPSSTTRHTYLYHIRLLTIITRFVYLLPQVQCPNIHFHAHSDGSTTIHRHKSCKTPGNTEWTEIHDPNRCFNNSDECLDLANAIKEANVRQQHQQPQRQQQQDETLQSASRKTSSDLSEFSQRVEHDRYVDVSFVRLALMSI